MKYLFIIPIVGYFVVSWVASLALVLFAPRASMGILKFNAELLDDEEDFDDDSDEDD